MSSVDLPPGAPMRVSDLFESVGLEAHGPVAWRVRPPAPLPGVYVVARTPNARRGCKPEDVRHLPKALKSRWLPEAPVLYIGCTTQPIADRLAQFYQHHYGDAGPHAGGQHVLLMRYTCPLWVYWAATGRRDPREVEAEMLRAFKTENEERRPFANGTG